MKNKFLKFILSIVCIIWFLRIIGNKEDHAKYSNTKTLYSRTWIGQSLRKHISTGNEMDIETSIEYSYDYKKLLKFYNLDEKRFFHMPFVSYITSEKWVFQAFANHIYASDGQIIYPETVNCGDIIYVKTDYLEEFVKTYHYQIKNPYILMTQQSDYKIGYPWHFDILNDPKIMKWYAINVIAKHPKLEPIPCGFAPPIGQNFSILYNMAKKLIPFHKRSTLLDLSFTPYIESRSKALKYFKKAFKNNKDVVINEGRIEWSTYLSNFGNTKFVLSPPGNGIDPHRNWESLAMGAVPIVLNQSDFQSLFDDMPVMVVNDWTEVTEENMEKYVFEKLTNKLNKDGIPRRPKLWLRYWITKIMNEKNNLVQQFC